MLDRLPAWLLPVGLALLSLAYKAALLSACLFPLNADEAIVALMGRHILAGARPAFFYGQAYMGSLDAVLAAAGFALFGSSINVVRWIQAGLYAGSVAATVALTERLVRSRRAALVAGLLMALPAVNVTLYTTVSLGGYGEALFIGSLLLLLASRLHDEPDLAWANPLWGFLAGLGFWAFPLVLVFALPGAWMIGRAALGKGSRHRGFRRLTVVVAMAGLGGFPWIAYAAGGGLGRALAELGGSAIRGVGAPSLVGALAEHALNLVLFGPTVVLGLRAPWSVELLARPLLPLVIAFWLLALVHGVIASRRPGRRAGRWVVGGVAATLILAYVVTPFGADPSGRYFLPLAIPLAVWGADMVNGLWVSRRAVALGALLAAVLVFHVWSTLEAAGNDPPGLTTQFDPVTWIDHDYDAELIAFLREEGELRGYTNYWVAYPLAFLSEEELIFVPHLPYHTDFRHTPRDSRYAPYEAEVESSERVAYITTFHPPLDQRLRRSFEARGIEYREAWIGDYHVFYRLSRPIRPAEIGLGPEAGDQP